MKFTFDAKAFPPSKGNYFVVCEKDGKQCSAVAVFIDEKNAHEDAVNRNNKATEMNLVVSYQVCSRADGEAVVAKKEEKVA